MVGVDQQSQVAGAANAVSLAGEFGQCQDNEIGGAEHRHRPDRARKHPDFEAEILGDARRDRVVHRSRMDAAVAGKDRAKALTPFGPVHRFMPSQVFGMVSRALSLSWPELGQRGSRSWISASLSSAQVPLAATPAASSPIMGSTSP